MISTLPGHSPHTTIHFPYPTYHTYQHSTIYNSTIKLQMQLTRQSDSIQNLSCSSPEELPYPHHGFHIHTLTPTLAILQQDNTLQVHNFYFNGLHIPHPSPPNSVTSVLPFQRPHFTSHVSESTPSTLHPLTDVQCTIPDVQNRNPKHQHSCPEVSSYDWSGGHSIMTMPTSM